MATGGKHALPKGNPSSVPVLLIQFIRSEPLYLGAIPLTWGPGGWESLLHTSYNADTSSLAHPNLSARELSSRHLTFLDFCFVFFGNQRGLLSSSLFGQRPGDITAPYSVPGSFSKEQA